MASAESRTVGLATAADSPAEGPHPSVGVVIACFSDERWGDLDAAVRSVLAQTLRPAQVIVVVDGNERLHARLSTHLAGTGVVVVANEGQRGASGARNTGVRHLDTDLVAILDDDAEATPDWLEHLIRPFEDRSVVGVGGAVVPNWALGRAPTWFPPEFLWVVGASYHGMPETATTVRNVWAENMAARRELFYAVGGFRDGFGKVGTRSRPEDTDLCIRMSARQPGGHWVYEPLALVAHRVPADRSSYSFYIRRCYNEGRGKAELTHLLDPDVAMQSENDYVRRILPGAALSALRGVWRPGLVVRVRRSVSVIIGLCAAAIGYLEGRVRLRASRDQSPA